MATLISKATGNFTSSTTWATCDSTAEADSTAVSGVNISTSNVDTVTFAPGSITVDGIALKIRSRLTSPTGTFTVTLRNSTLSTDVTSVTVNVSDLPSQGWDGGAWIFFKFSSSQLLLVATNYLIRCVCSNTGNQVNLAVHTSGGGSNFQRQLRTTTESAPGAGGKIIIVGELTGAGTGNSFTITNNNTATTIFGDTTFPASITVNQRGIFTYGNSASTNYYLKYRGRLVVTGGGTFNIGTTGTPIPSSSTAVLEMDSTVNVNTGLDIQDGGTFVAQGASKSTVWTYMTADKVATNTVIGLTSTSGWAVSDELAFASTSQTSTQCEQKTILTVDSSTQVTLTAGLTNNHSGTSPTQAEVGNLTRNVKIRGISTSLQGYIIFQTVASADVDYVEFSNLGSATASKRGIDIATTTGAVSISYSSFHDFTVTSSFCINISSTSGNNFTFDSNVFFNNANACFNLVATTAVHVLTNNLILFSIGSGVTGVATTDIGLTFTNNHISGFQTTSVNFNEQTGTLGIFSGNELHSNTINFSISCNNGLILNCNFWRTNNNNISPVGLANNLTYQNCKFFGCTTSFLIMNSNKMIFDNCTFAGDTTFPASRAFGTTAGHNAKIYLLSCSLGVVSGIFTANTIADIALNSASMSGTFILINTTLGSTTQVSSITNSTDAVFAQKLGGTTGNHKTWLAYGIISIDTTIFNTASPSLRMTPNSASSKLQSALEELGMRVAVSSGNTVTISVKVRKSVVGDGTAYNGNQPRLFVRRSDALGISTDTLLATASGSAGSWETLSGTTSSVTDDGVLEFYVDCDGTTGWINVDDWLVV